MSTSFLAVCVTVFFTAIFLIVVVHAKGPRYAKMPMPPPPDRACGWKQDPAHPSQVRYFDGTRWAALAVPGTLEDARRWKAPLPFRASTRAIRALSLTLLYPLLVAVPFVMLVAIALSRAAQMINVGGSNK